MSPKAVKVTTREATKLNTERKVKGRNRTDRNKPRNEVKKMSTYKGLDY